MTILRKTLIAAAAFATIGTSVAITSVPAFAAGGVGRGLASRTAADWNAMSAQTYQAPGAYDSLADFSRSVEGTPCGITCTQEHQMRRGYVR